VRQGWHPQHEDEHHQGEDDHIRAGDEEALGQRPVGRLLGGCAIVIIIGLRRSPVIGLLRSTVLGIRMFRCGLLLQLIGWCAILSVIVLCRPIVSGIAHLDLRQRSTQTGEYVTRLATRPHHRRRRRVSTRKAGESKAKGPPV